jgi:hypothetical protein
VYKPAKAAEEMLQKAAEYHLQNKFEEEVETLNKIIQLNPRYAEAYYQRCQAYFNLHKYGKAREDAYKAELEGKLIDLGFINRLRMVNEEFDKRAESIGEQSLEIALAKEGLSMKDLGKVTQHYYEDPQPDKLMLIVKAMLSDDWLIHNIVSFGPLTHLVATVAHNNQGFLNDLKSQKDSFTGMRKDAINEIIYEAENFRPPKPKSPQGLDYLWVEFFATGSDEPVKKIISVLEGQGAYSQMTRYSAEWSLRANAKQDKRVRRIIKDALAASGGELKESLAIILKK